MLTSNRLSRWVITAAAIIAGVAFIVLAITTLDFPQEEVIKQLVAVFVLLLLIIGCAALLAWLVRFFIRRVEHQRDQDSR